jgi:hypothetical protein
MPLRCWTWISWESVLLPATANYKYILFVTGTTSRKTVPTGTVCTRYGTPTCDTRTCTHTYNTSKVLICFLLAMWFGILFSHRGRWVLPGDFWREDARFLRGINSRTTTNRVENRLRRVVGKIAGKEFSQQHIARGGEHPSLPPKMRGYYSVLRERFKKPTLSWPAIFFPNH